MFADMANRSGMGDVLTSGCVARLCAVSVHKVHEWSRLGLLPMFRLPGGTHRRYLRADVVEFMSRHGYPESMVEAAKGGIR